jgi:hypothetical protein
MGETDLVSRLEEHADRGFGSAVVSVTMMSYVMDGRVAPCHHSNAINGKGISGQSFPFGDAEVINLLNVRPENYKATDGRLWKRASVEMMSADTGVSSRGCEKSLVMVRYHLDVGD